MKQALGIGVFVAAAVALVAPAGAQEAIGAPGGGLVAKIETALAMPAFLAPKDEYDRIYAIVDGDSIGRGREKVLLAHYIRKGMLPPGSMDETRAIKSVPGAFTVMKGAWLPRASTGGCNFVAIIFDQKTGAPVEYQPGRLFRCNAEDPIMVPVAAPAPEAAPAEEAPAAETAPAAAEAPAAPPAAETPPPQ